MSSQRSNLSSNSFADNSFGDLQIMDGTEFSKLFEQETDQRKKLEMAHLSLSEHLPNLNESIMVMQEFSQYIIPSLSAYHDHVLHTCASMVDSKPDVKCDSTFQALKENLTLSLDLMSCLDSILMKLLEKQNHKLCEIQNILIVVGKVVLSTFQFCVHSSRTFFGDLEEILQLFKKNQDLLSKFLKILEGHVEINLIIQQEVATLHQILDNVELIGEILSGVNVKSYADTWKNYTTILQKHRNAITKEFNMERPVAFLCLEVVKIAKMLFEIDVNDAKTLTNNLKVASFVLKVIVKLSETFARTFLCIHDVMWTFFCDIYCYAPLYLEQKQCSENIVKLINVHLFSIVENLCFEISKEPEFIKAYARQEDQLIKKDATPFLLLGVRILDSLACNFDENKLQTLGQDFSTYFKGIFQAVNCYSEWSYEQQELSNVLYDNLVSSLVCVGLILQQNQYVSLEELLLVNVFSSSVFGSIYATDVWILLLKYSHLQLCFETLCTIAENCQNLLSQNICISPQYVQLQNLLKRMFGLLNANYKLAFIDKYELCRRNVDIWRCIGLSNFPNTHSYLIERLITKLGDFQESVMSENVSSDDFIYLCALLKMLASENLLQIGVDTRRISQIVKTFWSYVDENCDFKTGTLFSQYVTYLGKLTSILFVKLDSASQELIMNKISTVLVTDATKLTAMLTLQVYCETKRSHLVPNKIFSSLFNDKNPIIQHEACKAYSQVRNILMSAELEKVYEVQLVHLNFDCPEVYFRHLCTTCVHQHRCVSWNNCFEPLFKKIKCETIPKSIGLNIAATTSSGRAKNVEISRVNDVEDSEITEVSELIDEIRKYAKSLAKHSRDSYKSKDVYRLRSVITQLHNILE